jgi:hypothetical protein
MRYSGEVWGWASVRPSDDRPELAGDRAKLGGAPQKGWAIEEIAVLLRNDP